VARALREHLADSDRVLAIDAGPAPENYTGLLRRFRPDLVMLVDAALMDDPPGTVRWLPFQEISGTAASMHTLSLSVLARFVGAELGSEVALLGIQPARSIVGAPLSAPVRAAVEAVTEHIARLLAADPMGST